MEQAFADMQNELRIRSVKVVKVRVCFSFKVIVFFFLVVFRNLSCLIEQAVL